MRNFKRFSVKVLLFLALLFGAKEFCASITQGFTLTSIEHDVPFDPKWEVQDCIDPGPLLSQSYTFLGKGGQAYAFLSADGKHVVKFFKTHPFQSRFALFSAYHLAYTQLREESGLLYLHLNPTPDTFPPLRLIDPLGIAHSIDLNRTAFLIQKKAEPFFPTLDAFIQHGDRARVQASFHALLDTLVSRSLKGIRDRDAGLKRNWGYLGDRPICIDPGSLIEDAKMQDPAKIRKELHQKTRKLRKWLLKYHPEYLPLYEEEMARAESPSCP